jgi:hypothetical protein
VQQGGPQAQLLRQRPDKVCSSGKLITAKLSLGMAQHGFLQCGRQNWSRASFLPDVQIFAK